MCDSKLSENVERDHTLYAIYSDRLTFEPTPPIDSINRQIKSERSFRQSTWRICIMDIIKSEKVALAQQQQQLWRAREQQCRALFNPLMNKIRNAERSKARERRIHYRSVYEWTYCES